MTTFYGNFDNATFSIEAPLTHSEFAEPWSELFW